MPDWISFWDDKPTIYVNARHKQVHYAQIAQDLERLIPSPTARVLDFGCGEALSAERLAGACAALVLSDAAPSVRAALAARHAGAGNITISAPEEVLHLPEGSFDLIIVNSVLQYLARDALPAHLADWRRLLSPGGALILADVISPRSGMSADVTSLLALAAKEGFLLAALSGLVRTALSPYRTLRAELGLTMLEEDEMLALLAAARLSATRVRPNVGHNQNRMTFKAVRPD